MGTRDHLPGSIQARLSSAALRSLTPMGKNLVLAFTLILAIGVLSFFFQQQEDGDATRSDASPVVRVDESSEMKELPSHEPTSDNSPSEDRVATARVEESERREAADVVALEDGFAIACVDQGGNPVGDLEAWVLVDSSWAAFEAFVNPNRVDAYLEENGTSHRFGPKGRLNLSRPDEGRLYVLARGRGYWGTLDMDEVGESVYKLVVIKDASLRVQVIDAQGQPLRKVPVVIERFGANGSMRPAEERTGGKNGMAVFPHVQAHLIKVEESTYRVFAEIVSMDLVHAVLDPGNLPTEPIVLQLPPTGSVRVRVLDTDWELVNHDASVTLECIPDGEAKVVSRFSATRRRKVRLECDAGIAVFPHVEIGLELGGEAKRGNSQVGSRAYGPGPLRVGQVANLDIPMGLDHPVVRFRPVRADGKSVGIGTYFCTLQMHTAISRNNTTTYPQVDEQGRVLVDLTNDWQEGQMRYLAVEYRGGFKPFPSGGIDLSRELQKGINDLGDLVLGDPAVFVSGRVETDSGKGVANAQLSLRSQGQEGANWSGHWDFKFQTESDGTFEITEATAGHAFQLSAKKAGFACGWFEFASGDDDVTIVMRSHGQIAGSILLDDEVSNEMIVLRIDRLADGEENRSGAPSAYLDENGEFLFEGLMPGMREIAVRAKWQSIDLAVFEEIQVVSGEVCRDPRLQQIDLRGLLNVHTIEFLGLEEGQSAGRDVEVWS